ncbi:MAG: hypothetical protein IPL71_14250 [Anaerolineales bacterium]|uniref:hypothetical protein n=1 Tax=Candidatus Villigracilis proximus TaxID=3140683 RepID=UPI0031362392|nr:hypothetical protein [Anaerolineales bacterium]
MDKNLHPVHTGAGLIGYQFSIETSMEVGVNAVPNGVDVSLEGGGSETWNIDTPYQIPWWPW